MSNKFATSAIDERLDFQINNSLIGMILLDEQIVIQVNQPLLETIGLQSDDVLYHNIYNLYDKYITTPLEDVFPTNKLYNPKKIHLTLVSGNTVTIHYSIYKVYDEKTGKNLKLITCENRTANREHKKDHFTVKKAFLELDDQITVISKTGIIIFANWLPEKLVGYNLLDDMYQGQILDQRGDFISPLIEVLHTKQDIIDKVYFNSLTGRHKKINVKCVYEPDGYFYGIMGICSDITETEELRNKLKQLEKIVDLGKLAKVTAHELKNPLSFISALAQLGRTSDDIEKKNECFEKIIQEIEDVSNFLDDLSSLEISQRQKLIQADPIKVIYQVLNLVQGELTFKKIELVLDLCEPIENIHISPRLFSQALLNVIQNAIQALGIGGTLTISACRQDEFFKVVIKDNGPGIPPELLKELGSPFLTTKKHGTGLGIAITMQIIDQIHHGHIQFKSRPNHGTSVIFNIPVPR